MKTIAVGLPALAAGMASRPDLPRGRAARPMPSLRRPCRGDVETAWAMAGAGAMPRAWAGRAGGGSMSSR